MASPQHKIHLQKHSTSSTLYNSLFVAFLQVPPIPNGLHISLQTTSTKPEATFLPFFTALNSSDVALHIFMPSSGSKTSKQSTQNASPLTYRTPTLPLLNTFTTPKPVTNPPTQGIFLRTRRTLQTMARSFSINPHWVVNITSGHIVARKLILFMSAFFHFSLF